jgi:hypothetical protein
MIKKTIVVLLFVFPILVKSQVNVNVQIPSTGLMQKEQLWDLILVNNGNDMLDIVLQLNLQDAATGQVLLSATTGNMMLSKGVKIIKANDVQPISYTYSMSDFSRAYLPMGSFIVCYQVLNSGARKESAIAEECVSVQIDPLSPPLLISPQDKSYNENPYPQFSWIPPTPFDMFSSISYDLLVTEVLAGQTPTEAIQINSPIYSRFDISKSYESYATSYTKLDTGRIYAWQVVAKNILNYSIKSEVWTFKISPSSWVKELIEQTPFVKMKLINPEKGIAPNGILKIAYNNETADTSCLVKLKEVSGSIVNEISFEVKLNRGENLIEKDLQKIIKVEECKIYEADILNSRNEIWRMQFEVKKYKDKKIERN